MDNDAFYQQYLKVLYRTDGEAAEIVENAIRDAYKKIDVSSITENSVLQEAKNKADKIAIEVLVKISNNYSWLLLWEPSILGVDPGFRTGCKLAFLDENGNVVHTDTLYIMGNENQNATYKIEHLLKNMIFRPSPSAMVQLSRN